MLFIGILIGRYQCRQKTKVGKPPASSTKVRKASCANCRKNINDHHCESGGWNGSGDCTLWAPRNPLCDHPECNFQRATGDSNKPCLFTLRKE